MVRVAHGALRGRGGGLMVIWATVVGAVLGWLWAEFEGAGAVLGALLGSLAGLGLRAAVRGEIERAAERFRLAAPPVAFEPAVVEPPVRPVVAPPTPPRPAPAPFEREETPVDVAPAPPRAPAEPGPVERAVEAARAWAFGGNTVVRLGLVILFVGLSFLVRYAAAAGLFPIELRLAAVAAAGAALLGVGFRTRTGRPGFGLALQGGGVGVIYLALFAAVRLVPGFPVGAAFALMVLVCALGCALALLQGSQALAVTAFAGGYATPLLLSDGGGDVAGLFGYYTLLNLAVLFIGWRRAWRALNLLGFFATFGLASAWVANGYQPADFAVTQGYVAASVATYLLAAVLFARRTPGRMGAVVDTTLLFGPALAGFGLEAALVGDRPFGTAFAAVGFAALYLGVAAVATRRDAERFRVLHEAMLAIGVGFVTLAVPLALGARWTSAAWALEGAGAFWVGLRQRRWLPRAFGLALEGVAAILFLGTIGANAAPLPIANATFLGAMLVAGALIATGWWARRPVAGAASSLGRRYEAAEPALATPLFLAGFLFWWLAWAAEAGRAVPAAVAGRPAVPVFAGGTAVLLQMLAFVLSAGLWRVVGRRTGWAAATGPSFATLPALALGFLGALGWGRHVLFAPDWAIWAVAAGAHLSMLRLNDRDDDGRARPLLRLTHAGGVWLATAVVADCLWLGVDRGRLWNTSWAGVVFLASATAALALLTVWATRAIGRSGARRWPLEPHATAYGWIAALPVAGLVYAGGWATATASGETAPLPYLPLLNPVDLSLALALAALLLWRRTLLAADPLPRGAEALRGSGFLAGLGAFAFFGLNTAWLRIAHHWLGAPWGPGLLGDAGVQTGLAILWTLTALGAMVWANRRGMRAAWLVGAGLLALTVAKLLLVDLGGSGGGARIVAFIGVGALMLVLGYLAPLPSRSGREATA